jgi:outer membrane protein OmpA-like peptidoglycan-associated protein
MKRLVVLLLFVASFTMAHLSIARSNYVVIGAFRNKANAIHFADAARQHHTEAGYSLNTVRQLYYVFVMQTDDVHKAVNEVVRLRGGSEYTGAWVYHGVLGDEQVHDGVEIKAPAHEDAVASIQLPPPTQEAPTSRPLNKVDSAAAAKPPVPIVEVRIPDAGAATDPAARSKLFYFKIFTANGQPHDGNIELIDVDRQKKALVLKGNEPVAVKSINASGDLRFDCQVVGYRRVTQTINFRNPVAGEGGITIENNQVIVPFELLRLKEGDSEILYNVYFYKDAAIMRPESKYELDGLLTMMTENPRYRIAVHGHTNGNSAGRIIGVGETRNYFSLTGSKDGFGSAKELSQQRAELIRDYLASEGVAADRIEVKAWGGKKPIYKKNHPQASANVRVEIEILQE